MRVLAATPLYPPKSRVGAWLATHQFMRHLVQRGHEVTVTPLYWDVSAGWEVDGVQVSARGRSHAFELALAADVIVCHAGDGGRGTQLAGDKPLVVMVHGAGYDRIKDAELAVFNSASLRDLAGWSGRSIVCHPPLNIAAHRVSRTGDAVTIVNRSEDKGIKTVWRCSEAMPDHRFIGVKGGYGHQVTPRTTNFESWPTQPDMRDVWAQTRILAVPSAFETWGMVGVEAMCSGIPVIAHPTPGLVESLGPAGIFVDRSDTDGWVRELHRLDDPDEYQQASTTALDRVAQLLPEMAAGLDRFVDEVEALA